MARATFIKKAQKDIYVRGKQVSYESKKGKRAGQTLTKLDRTIPQDANDTILIHKGESYYFWQFMHGGINYSKTAPRPSQLTQSNFLSQYYAMQEDIEDFSPSTAEEVESFIEELKEKMESLRDECQDSLDNMPESLQYSPTGELLQARIDSLEEAISELENIEGTYDEPEDSELEEELDEVDLEGMTEQEMGHAKLERENALEELRAEKLQEWIDERLEEIGGISFDAE